MDKKIRSRSEIAESDKWDLSPLFNGDSDWEALYSGLEKRISGYSDIRGTLASSLEALKKGIEFDLDISRAIEKLYTYSHLKSDEDRGNQSYLAMNQKAMNLYTRISEASSFMTPEIQSIPDDVIHSYMSDESMADYRFSIEKIIRFKPHTHSHEIEEILAMSGEMAHAPSDAFSQLDNADLSFGNITAEDGSETELSHGNFSSFLLSPNRDIRRKAFFQYYDAYKSHKNTIASTLAHSNMKDWFYARVRKFSSCREAALFGDNVPAGVYDTLIETVKSNAAPLFEYLNFRREALGLDELHFYDTYVPLVGDINFRMEYDEAVETCVEALEPLGSEYQKTLRYGLLNGWVDRYENRGKRSGAYSSGCFDSAPYILLNYEPGNINSLYTLIHEAGHSMHSWFSRNSQPYVNHDYTIFVAEVASTFNETLLSGYLLKKYASDPAMTAYILNREIDNIRATLYRQTMFAEFEKLTHSELEANRPLTLDSFTGIYRGLLEEYFGDTLVVDDELSLECLRIPHFYSAFYVYKYATGISAAVALAEKVTSGGKEAADNYIDFLRLGGSMYPIDELKKAGVDMASPEPVRNALEHFSKLVKMFKEAYSNLKSGR